MISDNEGLPPVKFLQFFEHNASVMLLIDSESNVIRHANDAAVKYYGYSLAELSNMPLSQINTMTPAQIKEEVQRAILEEQKCFLFRHRLASGLERDVQVFSTPIHNDGSPLLCSIIHDISERKQHEEALLRQLKFADARNTIARSIVKNSEPQQILDDVVNTIGQALTLDRALIYNISSKNQQVVGLSEWLNPCYPDITLTKDTYPLSLFIGGITEMKRSRHWLSSRHDQVNPHFLQDGSDVLLHQTMMIKNLLWYPFLFHDDGYYLLVLNQIHSDIDWSSEELHFLDSVTTLVTVALEKIKMMDERKKAAEKILLSASLFTNASEAIMITTADGKIVNVNKAFKLITGYSEDEVIGENPRILKSGRHDKPFYDKMWSMLIEKGNYYGEIWNRHKNGDLLPVMQHISAVRDEKGKLLHYMAIFSDLSARKKAENEIHTLEFYDSLTNLPNRRLLMERIQLAFLSSLRTKQYGALLLLDMDHFKTLNDTLGHDYGDLLLIEVARRIQTTADELDSVARFGGDEFMVLVEDIDNNEKNASQKVSLIGEKIHKALSEPYLLKDKIYRSSPSIGITLFLGNKLSVEELLKQADIAMYQVKNKGRNGVNFFNHTLQQAVEMRAELENDLRHALTAEQFSLHYQLQIDDKHQPLGAEALIRLNHPRRGMISPAEFIPIAEESGLIIDIGNWVLNTAYKQLSIWAKQPLTRHLTLAVNVSAKQFRQTDFVEQLASGIRHYQIDPSRLKLELTESVVLNDVEDVVNKMYALKAMNVMLSMDDFGTGYSSLSYLKKLPLDQLKIDQSFVRDMTLDQNDAVMIQTIIDLAKNFGLDIIAEGVETAEQALLLKQMGCMAYQGYLYSRPVPLQQFEKLLTEHS